MRWALLTHLFTILTLCCGSAMAQVTVVESPQGLLERKNPAPVASPSKSAAKPATTTATTTAADAHTPKLQDENHAANATTTTVVDAQQLLPVSKTGQKTLTGYRVQAYFSSAKNGRAVARTRAKQIAMKYPHYRTYISYVAPQWRLRVGDFKDAKTAEAAAKRIKSSFPSFRYEVAIVPDKVNVPNK